MTPTTLRALRVSIDSIIESVTPDHPDLVDHPWARVRAIDDLRGPAIRAFMSRFLVGNWVEDGIFGAGHESMAELRIYTGYIGLPQDEDGGIIDADRRQLTVALLDSVDPVITGLIHAAYSGWTYEDETPGSVWGYHSFEIRWLAADD